MNFFHLSPEINVVLPLKMDLEKIKRFADSQYEGWKIAKAVTEVKNEIKNAEQGRDIAMSDVFKTLREPLIEQQKKTDAKQDAVIDQLKANQLALTGGLRDLVESNRDVLTLQQELPFPGVEAPPKEKPLIAEPNKRFEENELKFIKDAGLIEPNELLKLDKRKLTFLKNNVKARRDALLGEIGAFKRKKDPKESDFMKHQNNLEVRDILNRYLQTIANVSDVSLYTKKGSGIRKYKQPKRNAYKISDSSYGNLSVDVPRLMNEMKLNVFRGGKLIYHADADKSLVDLLTKRFNPRKKYSLNAVKIFNDLNLLANLPRHPSSGKSKLLGSGVVYYNDPNELAERMKILVGSMAAGNNSPVIKNDLAMINDEFLKIGAIDKQIHEKFYKKYIK